MYIDTKIKYCRSHFVQDCYLSEDGSELVVPFNIVETMAVLTKCSFDESHRQPISNLGGIPAIADLIQVNRPLSFHETVHSNSMRVVFSMWDTVKF